MVRSFTTVCERLTITLSQATVLVLVAIFQVYTTKSRDYLIFFLDFGGKIDPPDLRNKMKLE